jgi:hypothetical protein
MDLDLGWMITLFAIGIMGSFLSGMVGIGGSIIKYPMLLCLRLPERQIYQQKTHSLYGHSDRSGELYRGLRLQISSGFGN